MGNGQAEFLRALAGLAHASGTAVLAGGPLPLGSSIASRAAGVAYLPADRHAEGLLMRLSVRENASTLGAQALRAPGRDQRGCGASDRRRPNARHSTSERASLEAPVASLSGGNQQKVALARAMLTEPALVLADEPTQGVDVGARVEIYRILRDVAESGTPVLVVSSDGKELEGLCDRVLVFSRGHLIGQLVGDEVTEERMTGAIISATTHRTDTAQPARSRGLAGLLPKSVRRFAAGDYGPPVVLAVFIALLAAYTGSRSDSTSPRST